MKKIAFASVATLGLLGTAVVPAFGATSLTQSLQQTAQISAAANVHCKVRHWAHRRGFRDAIRGDAFAGRRGHLGAHHGHHRFHKDIDFDRDEDKNVNDVVHVEKPVATDATGESDLLGKHHHHRGHKHDRKPIFDIDVKRRDRHEDRAAHDQILLARDAGRIAHRWDERRLWGTEKWCRGRPVAGVHAGGGWHAKSRHR
ncbi:hypothetical protein AB0K60_36895 [Thermopolyspora sp. NPDC052614]|uniref:hypothetical protein n=1 Tax=Thermopolyspora sp. NPDC052614 TaxID=3155682 RepID=UPI00343917AA